MAPRRAPTRNSRRAQWLRPEVCGDRAWSPPCNRFETFVISVTGSRPRDADICRDNLSWCASGQMLLPRSNPLPDRPRYRDRSMGLLVGIDPHDFTRHERLVAALQKDREFEGEA